MSKSHVFLRYTRLVHLYLGVFTAPALIFFAFTGALQTFSLHETTRGSAYVPPKWAMVLAQIHKKQTPVVAVKKAPAGGERAGGERGAPQGERGGKDGDRAAKAGDPVGQGAQPGAGASAPAGVMARVHHSLPLKIFFLIVSVGLFTSTVTGLYMSYKYVRNRVLVTAALVLGAVIPVVLVFV